MSVKSNITYVLDNDPPSSEKERLNEQHRVFIDNFGHLLPDCVLGSDPGGLNIADIGTGTGIWIQELADIVPPTTILHGYDITDKHYPDPSTLASNIKFSFLNVLEPVPEELYEKYDVVHIRALCMVLKTDEWDGVVKNIKKLIKPGGYLMWVEMDPGGFHASPPTPIASELASLVEYLCRYRGGNPFCNATLPAHLRDNGFELLASPVNSLTGDDVHISPPSEHFMNIPSAAYKESVIERQTANCTIVLHGVIQFMAKSKIENPYFTLETAKEYADKFSHEMEGKNRPNIAFDIVSVVGKKVE